MISRRQFVQSLGVATAGAVGFGGYAVAEPWGLGVTRYRISPPRWPAGLSLKLAVVADLHACDPWMGVERIHGMVAHTNALQADCVLLLGDYVCGDSMSRRYAEPVAHKDWAAALKRLAAPLGVHAVLGNHDWWEDIRVQRRGCGPTPAGLALQDVGIPVYENDCVRLSKDGIGFWIAGLGDQWAFWHRRDQSEDHKAHYTGVDDLAGTLKRITDDAPVILMAHEPDVFADMSDRVSLTVAGHTHGGQVRVLGYAPVVPSRFGNRYVYGHVIEEGRHLVVSGGLGLSGVPLRFGSPPEIVMIEVAA